MNADQKLSSFRQRLADKIGPNRFNQLIESVALAKKAGRLRFWMGRFIENLPLELTTDETEFLNTFGQYESFLYVFGDAERSTYTVTRAEFDADPMEYFTDSKCDVPDEWIRDAWKVVDFREAVSFGIAWTIILTDDLYDDDVVETLERVLSVQDLVMLYECIRAEMRAPDAEWRHHFVKVFPMVEQSLPQPDA